MSALQLQRPQSERDEAEEAEELSLYHTRVASGDQRRATQLSPQQQPLRHMRYLSKSLSQQQQSALSSPAHA